MDCRACGTVNASGRRFCRECGGKLGGACPVCGFFNDFDDKHCGGCSRRLRAGGPLAEELPPPGAYAPAASREGAGLGDEDPGAAAAVIPAPAPDGLGDEVPAAGQEVSQTEIDGLFENMLDDDEPVEGNA